MAIVKNNPFGDVKGSIGPLTFTSNKAGQILRLNTPTHPSHVSSNLVNSVHLGLVSSLWRKLSDQQRHDWNDFALNNYIPFRTGNLSKRSGFTAFTAINSNILSIL